jgi:hypothetical protein
MMGIMRTIMDSPMRNRVVKRYHRIITKINRSIGVFLNTYPGAMKK